MFDSKMLIVILLIALVVFGTKRLRSIGTDLGAAVKGFKQAMNEGESEEHAKQLKHDADFDSNLAATGVVAPSVATPGVATAPGVATSGMAAPGRDAEVKAPPKPTV
jgi:sec-independent protein translocase protein TatA